LTSDLLSVSGSRAGCLANLCARLSAVQLLFLVQAIHSCQFLVNMVSR
jgi:hypothetical protein